MKILRELEHALLELLIRYIEWRLKERMRTEIKDQYFGGFE